jgi:hypothetical protein
MQLLPGVLLPTKRQVDDEGFAGGKILPRLVNYKIGRYNINMLTE